MVGVCSDLTRGVGSNFSDRVKKFFFRTMSKLGKFPSLVFSFPTIVLTVLENDRAQEMRPELQ